MKKFFETIKNIFKIEELRKRLVYTLMLILVYRFGCQVVLPGIDATLLAEFQSSTQEGLVGLLNMFSGGAFGNASIFALGVMPYISASIIVQLLGVFVPYFRKLQMEGESGRKKMNQLTRYLTILVLCIMDDRFRKHNRNVDFLEGFGVHSFSENDLKRLRWYDVILYLTMMIEVFYREFEDQGQYHWAKEMLLSVL